MLIGYFRDLLCQIDCPIYRILSVGSYIFCDELCSIYARFIAVDAADKRRTSRILSNCLKHILWKNKQDCRNNWRLRKKKRPWRHFCWFSSPRITWRPWRWIRRACGVFCHTSWVWASHLQEDSSCWLGRRTKRVWILICRSGMLLYLLP